MFTASARKTLMERNCSSPAGGGAGGHGGHRRCRRGKAAPATAAVAAVAPGAAAGAAVGAVGAAGEDDEAALLTGYRLASRDFIQEGGVFKAVRVTKVGPT